jgi:hypothetical protein
MIGRSLTFSADTPAFREGSQRRRGALLAALYLGWLLQSIFLQHGYEYIHAPAVLLALTLVAGWDLMKWKLLWVPVGVYLLAAAALHPLLRSDRLPLWPRCWQEGSTSEMKDRLALTQVGNWSDLQRVADFLRSEGVENGEVTCYGWATVSLYVDLDLAPSNRFPFLELAIEVFPRHREAIRQALADSRQRFVVAELTIRGLLTVAEAQGVRPGNSLDLPPRFPERLKQVFPWNEVIVFRAGRYVVYRVTKPIDRLH